MELQLANTIKSGWMTEPKYTGILTFCNTNETNMMKPLITMPTLYRGQDVSILTLEYLMRELKTLCEKLEELQTFPVKSVAIDIFISYVEDAIETLTKTLDIKVSEQE